MRQRFGRRLAVLFLALASAVLGWSSLPAPASAAPAPPPGYESYHTYDALTAELAQLAVDHPDLVQLESIGQSHEGREIWLVKVSAEVTADRSLPEVLISGMVHARERIANEMAMYAIHLLVDNYGTDARITAILDAREVWVIPMANPDGADYDIDAGTFHNWRKNRQPNAGTSCVGTDLNRNFGYRWGGAGSSGDPCSNTYRGKSAWSAPETKAWRHFVRSRVIDGRQQITSAIDYHAYGRLVLWPYGYTYTTLPKDMTAHDQKALAKLGKQVAARNNYTAGQSSSTLYKTSGDSTDWMYGEQRIFAYTIELAKGKPLPFYSTPAQIDAETERNRDALLYFLEQADCPYRAAGLAKLDCGPLYDDFEIDRDWQVDPLGTDTATKGVWQRGIPEKVKTAAGIKQRKKTASGRAAFVTGLARGAKPKSNSVNGLTSVISRTIDLPDGHWRMSLNYAFAHNAKASAADFLRVSVLVDGAPTVVFSVQGAPAERNAQWLSATANLNAFAGQTIQVLVEANGGPDRLVEAAVDDMRIYSTD
jgi:carboxypeptidase T